MRPPHVPRAARARRLPLSAFADAVHGADEAKRPRRRAGRSRGKGKSTSRVDPTCVDPCLSSSGGRSVSFEGRRARRTTVASPHRSFPSLPVAVVGRSVNPAGLLTLTNALVAALVVSLLGCARLYNDKSTAESTLGSVVSSLQTQVRDVKAALRAKERGHADLEHMVAALKEEATEHKRQVASLEHELRDAKSAVHVEVQRAHEAKEALDAANKLVGDVTTQTHAHAQEVETLKAEVHVKAAAEADALVKLDRANAAVLEEKHATETCRAELRRYKDRESAHDPDHAAHDRPAEGLRGDDHEAAAVVTGSSPPGVGITTDHAESGSHAADNVGGVGLAGGVIDRGGPAHDQSDPRAVGGHLHEAAAAEEEEAEEVPMPDEDGDAEGGDEDEPTVADEEETPLDIIKGAGHHHGGGRGGEEDM